MYFALPQYALHVYDTLMDVGKNYDIRNAGKNKITSEIIPYQIEHFFGLKWMANLINENAQNKQNMTQKIGYFEISCFYFVLHLANYVT